MGKTTLLEICARQLQRNYVTLDDVNARALAQTDPALFLQTWPAPVTIDEVQYAPQLFSEIKKTVDQQKTNGLYWLTGAQKFELLQKVSESLAGRVAIIHLLGLSQAEPDGRANTVHPFLPTDGWIQQTRNNAKDHALRDIFQRIWLGGYPRLNIQGNKARNIFYRSYVQTYLQRDVTAVPFAYL